MHHKDETTEAFNGMYVCTSIWTDVSWGDFSVCAGGGFGSVLSLREGLQKEPSLRSSEGGRTGGPFF